MTDLVKQLDENSLPHVGIPRTHSDKYAKIIKAEQQRLCDRLTAWWHNRGYTSVRFQPVFRAYETGRGTTSHYWEIGSNLTDRMPKKWAVGALAALVISASAHAQGVPPGALTLNSDGLGDGGVAFQWKWVKSKTDTTAPGFVHVFLQTGSNPEPYGRVTVELDPVMYPLTSTGYPRPLCSAYPAWTGPEYTPPGYDNPEPLGIVMSQGHYSAPAGREVDFWWSSGQWLPPHTAYSIIVICGSKAGKEGS